MTPVTVVRTKSALPHESCDRRPYAPRSWVWKGVTGYEASCPHPPEPALFPCQGRRSQRVGKEVKTVYSRREIAEEALFLGTAELPPTHHPPRRVAPPQAGTVKSNLGLCSGQPAACWGALSHAQT